MALKSIALDSLLHNRESKIFVLESASEKMRIDFENLLSIEQEKFQVQKEITAHTESVANTYKEEAAHLRKQNRKLKWQRAGLGAVAVIALLIAL